MPQKGSKRFPQLTRTGSNALRVRGRDSASKPAFVMPEELQRAKDLVLSGNAGIDQGSINHAKHYVDTDVKVSLVDECTNLSMDQVDVLSASTDRIITQARTMAPHAWWPINPQMEKITIASSRDNEG